MQCENQGVFFTHALQDRTVFHSLSGLRNSFSLNNYMVLSKKLNVQIDTSFQNVMVLKDSFVWVHVLMCGLCFSQMS